MSGHWTTAPGFRCTNVLDEKGDEIGYFKNADHARLAKAAPAMLEAAKSFIADSECYCLDRQENLGRGPCAFCELTSAIAQAEGRE